MALEPGTRLGPYEIVAPVPSGNLAETYKASDTSKNRFVTLRLLPAGLTKDTTFGQRMERDARAVSSLNHPHIAAIYDIGRHEDTGYVVTEHVEGETLAERLTRGPIDLETALKIAIAVADALDKAHRKGVVHRSLTPFGIMLSGDNVKLMDFGLEQMGPLGALAASASFGSAAPTSSAPPAAMATPTPAMPYQPPEQIEGKEPDTRSDIFAFGTILYEMVAGKPAFEGKTQALLIAAISSIDPEPLSRLQPMTPPALDYVVKRCLAKAPQKRLQTAWDLLCQLQWIAQGSGQGTLSWGTELRKRERKFRIALIVASLLALALGPAAYLSYESAPTHFDARFITSGVGFMTAIGGASPNLSPDGRWLISARRNDDADPGADALALDSVTKQTMMAGHVPVMPFWRPDSEEIAFLEDGKIKKTLVSGGPVTTLCDGPVPFGGGSWSRRGIILFSSEGKIYRVLDIGGDRQVVTRPDEKLQETDHLAPSFLPDDSHFLYLALSSQTGKSAIYVGSIDSADRTRLFESESKAVYVEPGYVLFNKGDVLYAQVFDAKKLALKGEPIRIADGVPLLGVTNTSPVSQGLRGTGTFAVSQAGVLAYRYGSPTRGRGNAAGGAAPLSIVWLDRTNRATPVGPPGTYAGISLSPDGKRFAVHRHEGDGGDIWLYDPGQGDRMQRLTFDVSQENSMPVWSPDGKRIAFASKRNGKWGIYVKFADNTGTEELVVEPNLPTAPMSWPASDQLVYWVEDPKSRGDIWMVPMSGERKPQPVVKTDADERFPQVSPDGKWIAYQAPDAMNNSQIWVNSFPKTQGAGWQVTNDGGFWPRWRGDGKEMEIYFMAAPVMRAVSLRVVGSSIQPAVPQTLFGIDNPNLLASSHYVIASSYYRYAVSADGQRFLMTQPAVAAGPNSAPRGSTATLSDAVINSVDQGRTNATALAPQNETAIILNWPRLMKQETREVKGR